MNTFSATDTQIITLSALVIWTLAWKGLALWKAATERDKVWFIILLFINTVGLLEIVYLFILSKRKAVVDTKN